MKQPTSFLENVQRFNKKVDIFNQRIAEWLNKKAIAIPLRILRFLFLCYAGLSILVFSLILYYGDDLFKEPSPQEIRTDPVHHKYYRLDQAPVKPATIDSLH